MSLDLIHYLDLVNEDVHYILSCLVLKVFVLEITFLTPSHKTDS